MSKVKKRKAKAEKKARDREFHEQRRQINLQKKEKEKEEKKKKEINKVSSLPKDTRKVRDNETLEKIEVLNELYEEELQNRVDYTTLNNRLKEVGLQNYLSNKATDEEIKNMENNILGQVNERVDRYLENEIENNQNRIINKMAKFYVTELNMYSINALKEIAKRDLDSFKDVEARLKDYLEDKDRYKWLMYDDRSQKDVQQGIEAVVDNILLDYGIKVSELRKEHYRKLGYKI